MAKKTIEDPPNRLTANLICLDGLDFVTGGDGPPAPPALPNCPPGMYPDQTYVNGQLDGSFGPGGMIHVGGGATYINTTCKAVPKP
jgi:hypothetical protein